MFERFLNSLLISLHFRFCVGDQFYLLDNKILCGPDYEERMLFANLQNHPDRLAQLKPQTWLLPPSYPSPTCPSSTSSTAPGPQGYSYPPFTPQSPGDLHQGPLPPKCPNMNHYLPYLQSSLLLRELPSLCSNQVVSYISVKRWKYSTRNETQNVTTKV